MCYFMKQITRKTTIAAESLKYEILEKFFNDSPNLIMKGVKCE